MLAKRIWLQHKYLCLHRDLNVKVVQIGKLICTKILGSKIAAELLKMEDVHYYSLNIEL